MDKKKAHEIVTKYIQLLRKNDYKIEKAFLFGSCSKGIMREDSDIDLALVLNDFPDSFDIQVQLMKLRRKIDTRIEPHPFRECDFERSNPLVREIVDTGLQVV